jgi:cell division inhibitor SulA
MPGVCHEPASRRRLNTVQIEKNNQFLFKILLACALLRTTIYMYSHESFPYAQLMAAPNPFAKSSVESLLQGSSVLWRGRQMPSPPARATGFASLDEHLPALIEINTACEGLGELALTLPLLQSLSSEKRPCALVRPPHVPYAPALVRAGLNLEFVLWIDATCDEDAHWAAEQLLRDGNIGAVLLWSSVRKDRTLRRLQLAAETGRAWSFLYRPTLMLDQSTSAAIRIALYPDSGGTRVELVKVRGGRSVSTTLPLLKSNP